MGCSKNSEFISHLHELLKDCTFSQRNWLLQVREAPRTKTFSKPYTLRKYVDNPVEMMINLSCESNALNRILAFCSIFDTSKYQISKKIPFSKDIFRMREVHRKEMKWLIFGLSTTPVQL